MKPEGLCQVDLLILRRESYLATTDYSLPRGQTFDQTLAVIGGR